MKLDGDHWRRVVPSPAPAAVSLRYAQFAGCSTQASWSSVLEAAEFQLPMFLEMTVSLQE